MSPAAAEFNSAPKTQSKHQQFTSQNLNPNPSFTLGALSMNNLPEQHHSSFPNGFSFGSAVSSRSKPRLVKKRQLGFQRGKCSTTGPPFKEPGLNSNQVYNHSASKIDASNVLTASVDGVMYGKLKNERFVFGASKSGLESNSDAESKQARTIDEVCRFNDVGFVFGADRSSCGWHPNPEWKERSRDGGKCGAKEFGKSENVGSLLGNCFNSDKLSSMLSFDEDKTQSGGMGERSNNESSSGLARSGANEFGESKNSALLFGNSSSPILNSNLENGQCAENKKSRDAVDSVFGAYNRCSISKSDSEVRQSGSEGFAFHGKHGNIMQNSIFEEKKYTENIEQLASDGRGSMNFDFGKVDDLGFIFHGNWSELRTNSNTVKNGSPENGGKPVPVDNQKMKSQPQLCKYNKIFVSEASLSNLDSEKGKTSQSIGNLSCEDSGKLKIDIEVETQKAEAQDVFVFGSTSVKSPSFSENMGADDEMSKLNPQHLRNDTGFVQYPGKLDFLVNSKSNFVFASSANATCASGTSTIGNLSDEMKKMTVCDCKKIGCSCHMKDPGNDASASSKPVFVFGNNRKLPGYRTGKSRTTYCEKMINKCLHRHGNGSAVESTEGFNFRTIKEDAFVFSSGSDAACTFSEGAQHATPNEKDQHERSWLGDSDEQIKLGVGESMREFRAPNGDTSCAFTVNLSPRLNTKFESSGRSISERGKGWRSRRGKLRRPFPESRHNHLSKEDSSQNMESPGNYSPMDFSPYQDSSGASNVTSSPLGRNEDLETESGGAVSKGDKKCRESNEEYLCSHKERVVNSSVDQSDSSNSNTKGEESKCKQNQFCFASREKDDVGRNFTFSASCTQDKLSATKQHNRKKYRMKVGHAAHAPNTTNQSQKVDAESSSLQFPVLPHDKEGNVCSKYKGNKEDDEQGSTARIQKDCQKWRIRGNKAYERGNLSKAEEFYTKGINLVPHSGTSGCCIAPLVLCYSNRAAVRMTLGRMREALGDCMRAAALDPNFQKVLIRAANCHLAMGEVEDALQYFRKCLETGPEVCLDRRIIIEAANGLQKSQKVAKCVNQCAELIQQRTCNAAIGALEVISGVLSISTYSEKLLEMKGEAILMLGRYEEVIRLCEQTLVFAEQNIVAVAGSNNLDTVDGPTYDKSSIKLWRWRLMAKSYFHLGRLEVALDFLEKQELLRSSEDRAGSNVQELSIPFAVTVRELLHHKNAGNEAFQSGRHTQAVEHYTAAVSSSIESRPFAAICFSNRAAAHQALGQISDAIADCSLAIALDRSYSKAVFRRATLHEKIRDYEQAASDLQLLISLFEKQSQEEITQVRRRHYSIEEKAKKGMSLDHYLILGIKRSDAASEIKKAYRKAALRHHPDKAGQFLARIETGVDGKLWKEIADEVHKDADRLFKMIGEAHAVLSDPNKRSQYDLEEELRNEQKGRNGSRGFRESPEFSKSPSRTTANGRYRQGYRYSYYDEW